MSLRERLGFARGQRLFWKILGVFLLALASALVVNIYLTRQLAELELDQHDYREQLEHLGETGLKVYQEQGRRGLKRWYQEQFDAQGIRLVLLDQEGIPLALPLRPRDLLSTPAPTGPQARVLWVRILQESHPIGGDHSAGYQIRVLPSPWVDNLRREADRFSFLRPLSTLVIVILASWWLSWHIAGPVRSLTRTSETLAAGALNTRTDPALTRRRDELGQLAESFNQMADRVEGLVKHHKQLLRDISHELRTPLTRQQLAIALLREEGANPQWLDRIERQTQVLNALIESVLSLSRLFEHTDRLPREPLDLGELISQICTDAKPEIEANGGQLQLQISPGIRLNAHAPLLRRAIENVVGNAIKYSPPQGTVRVSLQQTPAGVALHIDDQGPGIAPAQQAAVFTPFFRTDEARHSQIPGFGLGLSIAKEVIEQEGGRIHLHNLSPTGLRVEICW